MQLLVNWSNSALHGYYVKLSQYLSVMLQGREQFFVHWLYHCAAQQPEILCHACAITLFLVVATISQQTAISQGGAGESHGVLIDYVTALKDSSYIWGKVVGAVEAQHNSLPFLSPAGRWTEVIAARDDGARLMIGGSIEHFRASKEITGLTFYSRCWACCRKSGPEWPVVFMPVSVGVPIESSRGLSLCGGG